MNRLRTPDHGRAHGLYDEQLQRQQQEKLLIKERRLSVRARLLVEEQLKQPAEA